MNDHTNTNIWQGQRVRLRAIEPEDWEAFSAFDLDSLVARDCYAIPFPKSHEASRKWTVDEARAETKQDVFRFAIENLAGELVGTINTHSCEPRHGTFGYGIAIRREHWRKGYASEAIRLVLRYYFQELRYQKVTAHVYAFNQPSLKLHQQLGFQQEGRLRRMIYTDGAYHDVCIFGMTAEEFAARQENL
jgi:RimJ/RimL family protein N-acetyltransferase